MNDLAAKLTRDEAIVLVERIMRGDYADDAEADGWLDQLERDLVCPDGSVSGLIFWTDPELTAAEVVDRALAYQPIQMRSTPWTAAAEHIASPFPTLLPPFAGPVLGLAFAG
ncbi:e9imm peptide [Micromonospora coerulea]|uniref:e9imm peptide n=1 Tax=Micromonospora coerulea TaxID=47856 RepID=UPI001F3771CD|nr:e9imm peptide [Micromonospora veneta]